MATVDQSRSALDPRKHYTSVRMQQGRVLTDDDFNEAEALGAEEARRTRVDVIGPAGSPDAGFRVEPASVSLAGGLADFTLKAGTFYLGGHRVELEQDITFAAQPDFLRQTDGDRAVSASRSLAYLEVWQQPVSAVEDAELFEPALGGPDTTQRVRTMARVRLFGTEQSGCAAAFAELTASLAAEKRGVFDPDTGALVSDLRLDVDFDVTAEPEDLCAPAVAEGYLGAENAAIRVQLVDGEAGPALTWGFDNAAPLYRVLLVAEGSNTRVTFLTEPKDQAHWPLMSQVVEIVPFSAVLAPNGEIVAEGRGRCEIPAPRALSVGDGFLTRVAGGYDPNARTIVIEGSVPAEVTAVAPTRAGELPAGDGAYTAFLRVWDRGTDLASPPRIPAALGSYVTLGNTGLRVRVQGTTTAADAHWIIGARPNTPDVVVPWTLQSPGGAEPHGVVSFLAPLGLITWSGATGTVHDCRIPFRPLTRLRGCCTLTVGDGETSFGDFTSVQQAVNALPAGGGEICVLPGVYEEPIEIVGKKHVRIHGCGVRSVLLAPAGRDAVLISDSADIVLEDLQVDSEEGWCVRVTKSTQVIVRRDKLLARDLGAVAFDAGTNLQLYECEIVARELVEDPTDESLVGRLPLVITGASQVRIADNTLRADVAGNPLRRGVGGIQVAGRSTFVTIERNRILGGKGQGITLGHVTTEQLLGRPAWSFTYGYPVFRFVGGCLRVVWVTGTITIPGVEGPIVYRSGGLLFRVSIEGNQIVGMGGDGIGVAKFFDDVDDNNFPDDAVLVLSLWIRRNEISLCCAGEFVESSEFVASTVTHGPIALANVIDLVVEDNELSLCGAGRDLPLTGISAWVVMGSRITGNRATANGSPTAGAKNPFIGGIAVRLAAPSLFRPNAPAAVLTGNDITSPQGHPVSMIVFGTAMVQNNAFATRFGTSVLPGFGTGVLVVAFTTVFEVEGVPASDVLQLQDNRFYLAADDKTEVSVSVVHVVAASSSVVQGNLFHLQAPLGAFDYDLVVDGTTVQVQNNRLVEASTNLDDVFSAFANNGLWGALAHNIGSYCFLLYNPATYSTGHENVSLDTVFSDDSCEALVKRIGSVTSGSASYDRVTGRASAGKGGSMLGEQGALRGFAKRDAVARATWLKATAAADAAALLVGQQRILRRAIGEQPEVDVLAGAAAATAKWAGRAREASAESIAAPKASAAAEEGKAALHGIARGTEGRAVAEGSTVALVDAKGETVATAAVGAEGSYVLAAPQISREMTVEVRDPAGATLAKQPVRRAPAAGKVGTLDLQVPSRAAPKSKS